MPIPSLDRTRLRRAAEFERSAAGTDAMETRFGVPVIDPCVRVISRGAIETLPAVLAREDNVAPIALSGGVLTVAVERPLDFDLIDKLRYLCGMPIDVVAADVDRIRAVVQWCYGKKPET